MGTQKKHNSRIGMKSLTLSILFTTPIISPSIACQIRTNVDSRGISGCASRCCCRKR
ncbi:hypothetical protein CC86DRAFT_173859 [Ophiobolus disseminans]|uniref:Uncharacterized protein n=1 Tax=Ophiobolus disseminans TaxID=1469910 RepID=A0A6A7A8W4_9PLEO|nr:hypothetical protein CC86DRAFT_173859 [Ophiobolus disseminans]